jgi:large subunit ribosomal protein L25
LDFIYVSAETEVKVTVHLHFLNEDKCIGIKRGGMINFVKRDIELMCNPQAIPHHIDIDVSNLNIGDAIHVDEVVWPVGSRPLIAKKGITLVTVVGRIKEEDKSSDAEASKAK